tara:strand:+ start:1342 stop:1551 length:210 start_codon:yes stop_codon:yes gene_type:complete
MNEKQTHTKVLQVLLEEERSKSWLARKVGVSNTLMHMMLHGQRSMAERYRVKISNALNRDYHDLFSKMV